MIKWMHDKMGEIQFIHIAKMNCTAEDIGYWP